MGNPTKDFFFFYAAFEFWSKSDVQHIYIIETLLDLIHEHLFHYQRNNENKNAKFNWNPVCAL